MPLDSGLHETRTNAEHSETADEFRVTDESVIRRGFRYRLYPTADQAEMMVRISDAARFVYNLALEQRRDFWRQALARGVRLNYISQGRQLTELRAEVGWLRAMPLKPLQQALRMLDSTFAAYFAGRASFPAFRSKEQRPSFRHVGSETRFILLNAKWALIRVPKVGFVKMRLSREWRGRVTSATFKRDALGWHVSLACEIEHEAPANDLPAIGIDRGVANTLALSNGEMLSTPSTAHLERRKRKTQRILARRVRGSSRYRKQRVRLSRIAAKLARIRSDWQHRTGTDIARRFGLVALEDLQTARMARRGKGKRGLNRSILEQGWRGLETKLAYKLEERGGTLIKVNPAYTSQTCSACETIDKASRESQALFACRHCGFAIHADTNAAVNILRRSTSPMLAEGSARAPVEARTCALVA